MIAMAALLGAGVAFIVGLTSMGGGSLLTPALVLLLGLPAGAAVGVDRVAVSTMKSVSVAVYARRGDVEWPLVRWLAAGSVPAALAAVALCQRLPPALREEWLRRAVAGALLVSALLTVARALHARRGGLPPAAAPRLRRPLTLAVGALTGALVGLTSVGSGSLLMAFLAASYPMASRRLVGTDLAHALALTAASALAHGLAGNVNWALALAVIAGALPGALLGAALAGRVRDAVLRGGLAVALGVAGVALLGAQR